MTFTEHCNNLFDSVVDEYHLKDSVYSPCVNPYPEGSLDYLLYKKNWIDTVQWHLEDIIRDPEIDPVKALEIKRWIDKSNQERTDIVECIDGYFYQKFRNVTLQPEAGINTETPAWALDRLSILALKIYHMRVEANRPDAPSGCLQKFETLRLQREDLSRAISLLLSDLESGKKYMKLYKQMKMYNDPLLNPVLYGKK